MPRVEQQEATRAVGILGAADVETALAEGGRLLVAGATGNGNGRAEPFGIGLAQAPAGGDDLGQHGARNVQDLQQLVVPIELVDVVDERAAGVGHVGHVAAAFGQPPDEPTVDGAKEDLAGFSSGAQSGDGVEQVLDLRAGEVGVDDQSRFFPKGVFEAVGFQAVADAGRDATLPNDGIGHGLAGGALPQDGRLALIGDADGGDILRRELGVLERLLAPRPTAKTK